MLPKVTVPLSHDGIKGWIFDLVCPGYALSVPHNRLLLLKNATVNWNLGFDKVCKDKQVSIAYGAWAGIYVNWDYDNNRPFEDHLLAVQPRLMVLAEPYNVAYEEEIHAAFFKRNNIRPQWHWTNVKVSTLNEKTGQWSGAIGLVQRDEVDYAVGSFFPTYTTSKVVTFSAAKTYSPIYLFSRKPRELSSTWNLIGLFTKE